MTRWFAPVVFAAGLAVASLAPSSAHAQSHDQNVARVIVDVADVIFRSGQAYDRRGRYGHDDLLVVVRDRYGRPFYYRSAPGRVSYGPRYRQQAPRLGNTRCDRRGRCTVTYYDARRDNRYSRWDHRYDDRGYRGSDRGRGRGHGSWRGRDRDRD